MRPPGGRRWCAAAAAALCLLQVGCASLVSDARTTAPASAKHCEGAGWKTSTHIAVLPIPVVAFFTPRITTNAPDSAEFLNHCGGRQQMNRKVEANYAACAPIIFLTTIITLGIAGVCPTLVQYQADIVD